MLISSANSLTTNTGTLSKDPMSKTDTLSKYLCLEQLYLQKDDWTRFQSCFDTGRVLPSQPFVTVDILHYYQHLFFKLYCNNIVLPLWKSGHFSQVPFNYQWISRPYSLKIKDPTQNYYRYRSTLITVTTIQIFWALSIVHGYIYVETWTLKIFIQRHSRLSFFHSNWHTFRDPWEPSLFPETRTS